VVGWGGGDVRGWGWEGCVAGRGVGRADGVLRHYLSGGRQRRGVAGGERGRGTRGVCGVRVGLRWR
jgi:hypothetical protein